MSVVNLSVHRNTRTQRRSKELRRAFREAASGLVGSIGAPTGFAIVVWGDGNEFSAQYRSSPDVPSRLIPEMARSALTRAVEDNVS